MCERQRSVGTVLSSRPFCVDEEESLHEFRGEEEVGVRRVLVEGRPPRTLVKVWPVRDGWDDGRW